MVVINKNFRFINQDGEANLQIRKYLELTVSYFLKELPGIRSILLAGGFGRGEGSVVINKDNQVIPQNDFELFLITEQPVEEELINKLANDVSQKFNIGQVGADFYNFEREIYANTFYLDVKVIPRKKLPSLLPMFRYYELKHASYILWGEDLRDEIPDFKIKDFPLTEGLRLLLNRMALLCHYFSFDFLKKMSYSEKHGLMYLGYKASIDLAGALTQLDHSYKPSYLKRANQIKKNYKKNFPELFKKIPKLPKIIFQATQFKLNPDFSQNVDPYKFWLERKKYIKEVTLYFSQKFFNKKFKNIFQLADFLYQKGHQFYYHNYLNYFVQNKIKLKFKTNFFAYLLIPILNILFFFRILKTKNFFYPRVLLNSRAPDLTMFAAMIYILYGVEAKRKINKHHFNKAKYYLSKTYPITKADGSLVDQWEQLKDDFSNAFLLFSFLKMV